VKLAGTDLMTLEQYARERAAFRARVLEHKRVRQLQVGPNSTWSFEDRLTVQYQIQEMLRIERIFEPEGILDELAAYNPLIPDGSNWKATLLIEFAEPLERRAALAMLKGIETHCWVRVAGHARVPAIADEDLPRTNEEKTSAVHFLRFELDPAMIGALRAGAALGLGVDHDHYRYAVEPVPPEVRTALLADLD
jgi:hypothetical protein